MANQVDSGYTGSVDSVVDISSFADNEVQILPSSYVPRRLKLIIPKSTLKATTTVAPIPSSSLPQQQHQSCSTTAKSSLPDYYDDPSLYTMLKENELLRTPQDSHLSFLYAPAGFGSTSLMVSLIVQVQQDYPDRWVSYMDLRKVATFMEKSAENEGVHMDSWTMANLTSSYNKITSPSAVKQVEDLFKSSVDDLNKDIEIMAELFLDELDEVSPKMQQVFLKVIARDVAGSYCRTRIWISSRPHLKTRLENLFPQANTYELVPLIRSEQIDLLASYWKITNCPNVSDAKLKNFTSSLHDQMEKLIPNFYKTVGACPSHLLQIPDFFTHIVTKLEEDTTENQFSTVNVSVAKVFEKFVKTRFEAYIDKLSCEQPTLAMTSLRFREKEFRKLERSHVKAVIQCCESYPNFKFKCDAKTIFAGACNQQEQAHELYRVGICYEVNGEIRFIHPIYAEFIVAQYYVDSGRLKNATNMHISFFLNNFLFEDGCKGMRKFFDAYMLIQQRERKNIREVMVWNRLRCFLIKHYRLNDEAEASSSDSSSSSSSNDEGDKDEQNERTPKLTYEKIKGNGSIVHLSIMEGHFKLFQMIIDSFKGFPNELKKLLSITVPLEIYNENPFEITNRECGPHVHIVSPFQMIAMFGYGAEYMEKNVSTWFQLFGYEHMMKYFDDGTWTVLHYAAMNSNCHFLHGLLSKNRKWGDISVNQWNPEGQQPIHLVLTKCWYYSIKIVDHPHPVYKSYTALTLSSKKTIAIQDAINAVSPPPPLAVIPQIPSSSPATPSLSLISSYTKNSCPTLAKRQQGKKLSSSKKKCNPMQKSTRRQNKNELNKRQFKDIWCSEGVNKEFISELDSYPEDMEHNPLRPHLITFRQLYENGGNVNAQENGDGRSVLHQAAHFESVKIVKFLMNRGADVNLRDNFGKTPAHYAEEHGQEEVLQALIMMET